MAERPAVQASVRAGGAGVAGVKQTFRRIPDERACRSSLEPVLLLQKRPLLRRALPAQHRVAVREAAEAGDDVAVAAGPFRKIRLAERLLESDGALLVASASECMKGR